MQFNISNLYSKDIVLIDEFDRVLGIENKILGHNVNTKLHRGFSLFLINDKNEFLLQKRSKNKTTWPNFWSNSVCGHPQENESYIQAAIRCAKYELNVDLNLDDIHFVTKQIYQFSYNNISEHELCYVFIAKYTKPTNPNLLEIKTIMYKNFAILFNDCNLINLSSDSNNQANYKKEPYTPWFLLWLPYIKQYLNAKHNKIST